ncbi:hypothetical protein T4B_6197 [Trichinella pseudospiralis]|uniref:Uncharacterized protein n=2 Tax=Trichinella pseudospiralis TaxID=6337 RepID=A0A0V1J7G3_TRIPS|nr:hypothetical protein T4B_6197 [Trichinella pseudospiralis]
MVQLLLGTGGTVIPEPADQQCGIFEAALRHGVSNKTWRTLFCEGSLEDIGPSKRHKSSINQEWSWLKLYAVQVPPCDQSEAASEGVALFCIVRKPGRTMDKCPGKPTAGTARMSPAPQSSDLPSTLFSACYINPVIAICGYWERDTAGAETAAVFRVSIGLPPVLFPVRRERPQSDLDGTAKFAYLLSCLTGKARGAIEEIPVTAANYTQTSC